MDKEDNNSSPGEPSSSSGDGPPDLFARYQQQIAGFVGWFVIASVLAPFSWGFVTFPGTIVALVAYGGSKDSKGVAGGILAALALNFIVSLARGLGINAACFIPFYIDFSLY